MERTVLSGSGLRVSQLGLGTATFGLSPSPSDADRLIGAALDAGINYVDTANSYGNQARFDRANLPAASERLSAEEVLGAVLGRRRSDVVVASKVGEPTGSGPNDWGLSRTHMARMLERSLVRLQTDYVDIYYAHHPDPNTDIAETLSTFDDFIRQGKIRYYALSTFDGWQLSEAVLTADRLGLRRPICHQTRYSLAKRWVEQEVLPAARHFGVSTTVFSPLAGGLLADGAVDKTYVGDARWGGAGFTAQERDLAQRVATLAKEWGHSSSTLALAWLLAKPGIATAVVGPETVTELQQLLPSCDVTLTKDQLAELDGLLETQPTLWT
ncbi:aldo/keto reductase [Dactylosporangium sp. CA-233914]|uniref:aldo/keto reductase n=1 Tax=Dactylosporangium sp. CA-233914 TaxID=3239934 RepID=UPI003D93656E